MKGAHQQRGFTLVELLVVIAIIAVLAVVVTLTINPAQLLAQSRDSRRISDMASLNATLNLYKSDQLGGYGASAISIGSSSVAYLSVPDPTASGSGNQCTGLGMPSSSGYAYQCAASTTYLSTAANGWLPVNFAAMSSGNPFGTLPVDPVNQTSSNLYYTYETDGTNWALTAFFESQKYATTMTQTGGIDPALYEIGPGIATLPEAGRGLVGYWPLNAATGSSTADFSGDGNAGTWSGSAIGANGTYYAAGKVGSAAGDFDGSTDAVSLGNLPYTKSLPFSLAVWIYPKSIGGTVLNKYISGSWNGFNLFIASNALISWYLKDSSNYTAISQQGGVGSVSGYHLTANVWTFVVVTVNSSGMAMYINGSPYASAPWAGSASGTVETTPLQIGNGYGAFNGLIDDVRIYDRTLSAAEIQQIYNAEK